MLVRYGESADARHIQNQVHGKNHDEELEENLEKYPRKIAKTCIKSVALLIKFPLTCY